MIEREITPCLVKLFEQYPFVTVTGPRQSGKTTLCRAAFPHLRHIDLDKPNQREFAESDPQGFLSQLGEGVILDEIQRVPDLLPSRRQVQRLACHLRPYVVVDDEYRGRGQELEHACRGRAPVQLRREASQHSPARRRNSSPEWLRNPGGRK